MSYAGRIRLQVISSALSSICEEMGAALIRSAFSTNIKERRDCSTALFDADGMMVAQAEHIPVHLGAMPDAVAAVIEEGPRPGDVFILNDPYRGGTHLPDVTLVMPVNYGRAGGRTIAYAAARAHHADIGGEEPGSMPAGSVALAQEGVVIPPTRLYSRGELDEAFLDKLLGQVRSADERRGDLWAQLGALKTAERRLGELLGTYGESELGLAMRQVLDHAERQMRAAVTGLPDGDFRAQDYLEREDGDLTVAVSVRIAGDEIHIDFNGTSPQESGNLNCPMAVTRSACYFVLRAVADPDILANAGSLRPVHISAPEGCLVNARPPAAVAAGNVETSQRIVDALVLALSQALPLPAQGQGTMNNLTLGSDETEGRFTYYETIGGGAGGCPVRAGASGIHQGMTNTLNTPIEALEMAFPLRVERYEFREGSGGAGEHAGGEGVVRSLRLLAPARLSLLGDRRRHGPQGAVGGRPGLPGQNLVNGKETGGKVTLSLAAEDVVTVKSPGGGGYGAPGAGG